MSLDSEVCAMSKRRLRGWLKLFTVRVPLLWASTAAAIPTGPYFPFPDGATWTYSRSTGGSETEPQLEPARHELNEENRQAEQ